MLILPKTRLGQLLKKCVVTDGDPGASLNAERVLLRLIRGQQAGPYWIAHVRISEKSQTALPHS